MFEFLFPSQGLYWTIPPITMFRAFQFPILVTVDSSSVVIQHTTQSPAQKLQTPANSMMAMEKDFILDQLNLIAGMK